MFIPGCDPPPQGGGDYVGGSGAAIGEGLLFMLLLAGGYGTRKFNQLKRKKESKYA